MNLIKTISRFVTGNAPAILTASGAVGVLTTAILATKATYEATPIVDEWKSKHRDLTWWEAIKPVWHLYIPTAISASLTVAAIVGAHSIHVRRNAALMSLYLLTDEALTTYKEKVVETIGKGKARKIQDEVSQDTIRNNPHVPTQVLITPNGDSLCYDEMSGRYFSTSYEAIRRAENTINSQIIHEMYASLNDFYNQIGLDPTKLGAEVGWNSDRLLSVELDTMLTDENKPCLMLRYRVTPENHYHQLH